MRKQLLLLTLLTLLGISGFSQTYLLSYPDPGGTIMDIDDFDGQEYVLFDSKLPNNIEGQFMYRLLSNGQLETHSNLSYVGSPYLDQSFNGRFRTNQGSRMMNFDTENFGYWYYENRGTNGVTNPDLNNAFSWTGYSATPTTFADQPIYTNQLECVPSYYIDNLEVPKGNETEEQVPDPGGTLQVGDCPFIGGDALRIDEDGDGLDDFNIVFGVSRLKKLQDAYNAAGALHFRVAERTSLSVFKTDNNGNVLKHVEGNSYGDVVGQDNSKLNGRYGYEPVEIIKSKKHQDRVYLLSSAYDFDNHKNKGYRVGAFRVTCMDYDLNVIWDNSWRANPCRKTVYGLANDLKLYGACPFDEKNARPTGIALDENDNIYITYSGLAFGPFGGSAEPTGYSDLDYLDVNTALIKLIETSTDVYDADRIRYLKPEFGQRIHLGDIHCEGDQLLVSGSLSNESDPTLSGGGALMTFDLLLNLQSALYTAGANAGSFDLIHRTQNSIYVTGGSSIMKLDPGNLNDRPECMSSFPVTFLDHELYLKKDHTELEDISYIVNTPQWQIYFAPESFTDNCCSTDEGEITLNLCPTYTDFPTGPDFQTVFYTIDLNSYFVSGVDDLTWIVGDKVYYTTGDHSIEISELEANSAPTITVVVRNGDCYETRLVNINYVPSVSFVTTADPQPYSFINLTTNAFQYSYDMCAYIHTVDIDMAPTGGVWNMVSSTGVPASTIDPTTGVYTPYAVGISDEMTYTFISSDFGVSCTHVAKVNVEIDNCGLMPVANDNGEGQEEKKAIETEFVVDKALFQFYPNPASSVINLKSSTMSIHSVQVVDALGQIMKIESVDEGTQFFQLDLLGLQSGSYFLRVSLKDSEGRILETTSPLILE